MFPSPDAPSYPLNDKIMTTPKKNNNHPAKKAIPTPKKEAASSDKTAPRKKAARPAKPTESAVAKTGRTPAPAKTTQPATPITRAKKAAASPRKTAREQLTVLRPSGQKDDSFFDLVHEVARQIPPGRVTSYGAIAACLGTRLSARMVGWAMLSAHNVPNPVPAHRVVNRNGLLSGRHHYNPPERMQQLLEKEGVVVKNDQVVNFKKLFWDPATEL